MNCCLAADALDYTWKLLSMKPPAVRTVAATGLLASSRSEAMAIASSKTPPADELAAQGVHHCLLSCGPSSGMLLQTARKAPADHVRTRVIAQVKHVAIHAVHLPRQQRCLHSAPGLRREVVDPDVGRLPAVAQWQSRLQCRIGILSVIGLIKNSFSNPAKAP